MTFDAARALRLAYETFEIEAAAVLGLKARTDMAFGRAVQMMLDVRGRVVVMGMGKSGHIGRKVAATLASTGTPAMFVHPAEASHGDLGMIKPVDLLLAISNGGESEEITVILPVLKRLGVPMIAMTGNATSTLARHADVVLDSGVEKEACPLNLAPTASTTAALALGDALAVAVFEEKGFRREDFARLHPGGVLGRRLLTRVSAIMLTDKLPVLPPTATMREAIVQLAERRGIVIVSNGDRHVMGVVTAGDLSRLMEHNEHVFAIDVASVMTKQPKVARADDLGSAVVFTMEQHGIMAMPVVDASGHLVGVVHLHDLMRAGVA